MSRWSGAAEGWFCVDRTSCADQALRVLKARVSLLDPDACGELCSFKEDLVERLHEMTAHVPVSMCDELIADRRAEASSEDEL